MKALANHDISYSHKARQLVDEDFDTFDFIFGMDNNNINTIKGSLLAADGSELRNIG